MSKVIRTIALPLALSLVLAGCGTKSNTADKTRDNTAPKAVEKLKEPDDADKNAINKVITVHVAASNNKDLDGYVMGMLPELRESTRVYTENHFKSQNYTISLKGISILGVSGNEAAVKVTQGVKYDSSTKNSNQKSIEQIERYTITMSKLKGEWYIASTELDE